MDSQQDDEPTNAAAASVLIVEDEPSAREATALYLKNCGYDIATAADGEAALQVAAEISPDVVISDWRLGKGPDGVEVATEIARKYGSAIIFATAYPLDELKHASKNLRVQRYFRKPVSLPALADAVAAQSR